MQIIRRIILGEVSPDQVDLDLLLNLAEEIPAESEDYELLEQAIHIVLKHSVTQANHLLRQYLHESD